MFGASAVPAKVTAIVAAVGAVLLLSACGESASTGSTDAGAAGTGRAGQLQGTAWELDRAASTPTIPDGGTITLSIDPDTFSGIAACNNYFGQYTLEGADLALGVIGSTNMACFEGMEAEQAYLAALEKVDTVEDVSAERLVLSGDGVTLSFTALDPADALEGVWEITSINDGNALSSPVVGTAPTIEFTPTGPAAGTVSLATGCNTINSSYELDGAKISFADGSATQMACIDPAGIEEQEAALAAALESVVKVEAGQTLVLSNEAGQMVIVATPKAD